MILYLDTSSLFKLYHEESGTRELDEIFSTQNIQKFFLSELTKVEFNSVVWKKIRMNEISLEQGQNLITFFQDDYLNYTFANIDNRVISTSLEMLNKFGNQGLRTLDSIQLATAYLSIDSVDLALTSDKLLKELFNNVGLKTTID